MKQAVKLLLCMTILLGGVYTFAMWSIGCLFFSEQTLGSLIYKNEKLVGSELLSQKTESLKYFWPRPSAGDYATVASGASNLGPTSSSLKEIIIKRDEIIRSAHHLTQNEKVPADLLMASASGLDPDISPEAIYFQIARVSEARGFDLVQKEKLQKLVESSIRGPQWGILGTPRINVLRLNLELDRI